MTDVKNSKNWRSGLSIAECNRYMLKHEIHCDVSFKVGKEEKLVRAHKYVLASRSPVFDAMLYGDLAECNEIKIPDIEPSSFDVLLRFLYCGDTDVNQDTVIGTLYAADKYDVEELVIATKSYLDQNITDENVCTIFENAKFFNFENMMEKCMDFISGNCSTVFQSSSALDLTKEALTDILSSEHLYIEELEIYHFLIRWAENECESKGLNKSDENIRIEMGDTIYQIRFQFMKLDTFAKKVCIRQILSEKEKLDLIQVIVGNLEKESTKFNFCKRKIGNFIVFRSSVPVPSWTYSVGQRDCIEFTVNRNVKLLGIVMWGGMVVPYKYKIVGKLFENSNEVLDIPSQIIEGTDSSESQFNISLNKPVRLTPNTRYKVWVKIQGSASWKGNTYKKSVTERGVTFDFYRHSGENNATSEYAGQFPGFFCSL